jgi:hypothetical protein
MAPGQCVNRPSSGPRGGPRIRPRSHPDKKAILLVWEWIESQASTNRHASDVAIDQGDGNREHRTSGQASPKSVHASLKT